MTFLSVHSHEFVIECTNASIDLQEIHKIQQDTIFFNCLFYFDEKSYILGTIIGFQFLHWDVILRKYMTVTSMSVKTHNLKFHLLSTWSEKKLREKLVNEKFLIWVVFRQVADPGDTENI